MKVMTILGTRPEIIRLSSCIKACDKYFEHVLVHTGQNWDFNLNEIFFENLELRKPDYFLNCVGDDLGKTIGNIIAKSYKVMQEEKPDALLILGDTNSALSVISAKRLKIPIFHMEAGNRCWDWNVPEMINRKIVDCISDVNLPYTEHSRRYLLNEGVDGKTIFVTGSPMREVLDSYSSSIEKSTILSDLELKKDHFIVLSCHREENIDNIENFKTLMNAVNRIAEKFQMPIIFSTHPRSLKRIQNNGFKLHSLVKTHKPFGFFDYNKLQKNAYCVLSDSGTLSEESSMLNFPAVLIRTSTERPEALERGNVIVGGIEESDILTSIEMSKKIMKENIGNGEKLDNYEDKNVSFKIVKIIKSYTNIVNITTWQK